MHGTGSVNTDRIWREVGDPLSGPGKVVRVTYNTGIGDQDATKEYPEQSTIQIPIVELPPTDMQAFNYLLGVIWTGPGATYSFRADGTFTDSGTWVPKQWVGNADGSVTMSWKNGESKTVTFDQQQKTIEGL